MKRFLLLTLPAVLTLLSAVFAPLPAAAQCGSVNTAFKSGERLEYKLYFNWKFIWLNAGSATFTISRADYQGQNVYRTHLITRTSQRLDRFFRMRDTLVSYNRMDLVPLYYSKRAFEGKTYRRNEVWYHYADGQVHVKMAYQRNSLPVEHKESSSPYCMFDMLSMMLRARSFDPSNYKVGHRIQFFMPDGRKVLNETLIYRGKKTFQMENTKIKYRCLVFSFMEKEDGKEKEIVKFYISDDKNHLPVRLDMNLNFGTAKAYLTRASNLRNPQTSIIH